MINSIECNSCNQQLLCAYVLDAWCNFPRKARERQKGKALKYENLLLKNIPTLGIIVAIIINFQLDVSHTQCYMWSGKRRRIIQLMPNSQVLPLNIENKSFNLPLRVFFSLLSPTSPSNVKC